MLQATVFEHQKKISNIYIFYIYINVAIMYILYKDVNREL